MSEITNYIKIKKKFSAECNGTARNGSSLIPSIHQQQFPNSRSLTRYSLASLTLCFCVAKIAIDSFVIGGERKPIWLCLTCMQILNFQSCYERVKRGSISELIRLYKLEVLFNAQLKIRALLLSEVTIFRRKV